MASTQQNPTQQQPISKDTTNTQQQTCSYHMVLAFMESSDAPTCGLQCCPWHFSFLN
ncbi:hypothetical protein ADUPG1_003169, partial [Aduncisulcus paluster]